MTVLAAVVLVIWAAVFLQTTLNILTAPRLRRDAVLAAQPLVSIVIPARNEARAIERTIRAFLAQDYENFEIVVVNDRSTDATAGILAAIADPRLIVIDGQEPPPGWLGKPWALDQGSRRAAGELILLVDADIYYAPQAVRAAVSDLLSNDVAMVALMPHLEMRGFAENVAMPMLAFSLFAILPMTFLNRTRSPRLGGGGGSGNLVRRSALEALDYFTPLRHEVVDDIGLAWKVRGVGERTRMVLADDLISVRMYHGAREVVLGFTKNVFPMLNRRYDAAAVLVVLMVVLHLMPYALAILGNRFAIATVVLIIATRLVLFRALRYRLDNAVLAHPLMVAFWGYITLRSVWFTGIRNELEWRGRTYDAAKTDR